MNPVETIKAKTDALLASAPANDNATDPWAHMKRIQAEYKAIIEGYDTIIDQTRDMIDTMEAMNASTKKLIAQLIERGRPDFTPMEAEHA